MKRLREEAPETAERIGSLYEQTIDYGAHPNVDGVLLNSEVRALGKGRHEISTIFVDGEEVVLLAVLDLLRAMELVYRLLEMTVRDRLRLLGLDLRVDQQRKNVVALIQGLETREAIRRGEA